MDDYKIEVSGAPLISDNGCEPVINPLFRPNISYKKPVWALVGLIAFFVAVVSAVCNMMMHFGIENGEKISFLCALGASFLYSLFFLKKGLIWLIHLYQHFAPDRVRLKCVFEPSCSVYMELCIKKFGVIRGCAKGVCRLFRCHPPNRGKDYPY